MGGRVEVINNKGCSRRFLEFSSSFRGLQSYSLEPTSPASSPSALLESPVKTVDSNGPFSGLVICVTGLSKVRLSESLYSISVGKIDDLNRIVQNASNENSCLPIGSLEYAKQPDLTEGRQLHFSERGTKRTVASAMAGHSFYVDTDISAELHDKPLWVLKTAKHPQKLVHLSADLARNIGTILDTVQNSISCEEVNGVTGPQGAPGSVIKISHEERQNIANLAKDGVRKRRGNRMQTCQIPIRPITPSSLLDSICWSISDSTSTASIYTDSSSVENADEDHAVFFDAKGDGKDTEASFVNLSRPLTESEKSELIFKSPFLTVLFPIDRFSEMGPRSRTFFSDKGFTCLQVLDHIYTFYQENMSTEEILVAIHTDSRHADWLRAVYSSKQNTVEFKRIDFLGSRRSFEMLKRVSGDNNSNVYELLIRA
ncbi:BRCT domain-containing DNA repair protein [Forsythia ovata]|uniref:BRCT domain-containing DNA repair protein n=1 Tax=Forsythia ovata TaxID=205694 RepID=A0ABD1WF43_9LAMI